MTTKRTEEPRSDQVADPEHGLGEEILAGWLEYLKGNPDAYRSETRALIAEVKSLRERTVYWENVYATMSPELGRLRIKCDEIAARLAAAHAELAELRNRPSIVLSDTFALAYEAELTKLRAELVTAREDLRMSLNAWDAMHAGIGSPDAELRRLAKERDDARAELAERTEHRDALERHVAPLDSRAQRLQVENDDLRAELSDARSRAVAAESLTDAVADDGVEIADGFARDALACRTELATARTELTEWRATFEPGDVELLGAIGTHTSACRRPHPGAHLETRHVAALDRAIAAARKAER